MNADPLLKYSGHRRAANPRASHHSWHRYHCRETDLHSHPCRLARNRIALEERKATHPAQTLKTRSSIRPRRGLGQPEPICKETLANLLLWISSVNDPDGQRIPLHILRSKLHQFIAQMLRLHHSRPTNQRFITLEPASTSRTMRTRNDLPKSSAATGQPFLCGSSQTAASNLEISGKLNDEVDGTELKKDGYLIVEDIGTPILIRGSPEAWLRRPKSALWYPIQESRAFPASSGQRRR